MLLEDGKAVARATFGSKVGIIAATAGSAIGLGNIWRFPSETASGGGALFILVYICCVIFFGIPLVLAEFIVGRAGRANPAGAYRNLAPGKPFHFFGFFASLTGVMILSFYVVVVGWVLEYFRLSLTGKLSNAGDFHALFAELSNSPGQQTLLLAISVAFCGAIVACGVKKGIELASKIMMPLLLLILIVMGVRALTLPGASNGLAFLFCPNPENFSRSGMAAALGQSLFSLSVGMGTLIAYSSYFGKDIKLGKTAGQIAFLDMFFALFAGVIIFSAAFAATGSGMDSAQITEKLKHGGPGLVFEALPGIFNALPLGQLWATLFFLLLILAAVTSAISIYEPMTAFLCEEFKLSRVKSVIAISVVVLVVGHLAATSLQEGSDLLVFGKTVFDFLDNITANWMLPIGGIFVSWFTGWHLDKKIVRAQLENDTFIMKFFSVYVFILRYVAPLGIVIIFLTTIL